MALRFHETRNAHPDMFKSRPLNKMWYGKFGLDVMAGKDYLLAKETTLTVRNLSWNCFLSTIRWMVK